MCTIVILRRPEAAWPVLLAANRDERHDRPWRAPGRHWPDRPDVIAGLDALAGGSWLGLNDAGVVAAILNREGTLGPAAGKRSRGELVLEALDHADAVDAAAALAELAPSAYRPFNLLVADNRDAFLLSHRDGEGRQPITVEPLPEGLTMVTAVDRDDPRSPRIRMHRPRFLAAPVPDPDEGDWQGWEKLLADRSHAPGTGPSGSMFIDGVPPDDPGRFGTICSSLIALPSIDRAEVEPIWRFASGRPENWVWRNLIDGN